MAGIAKQNKAQLPLLRVLLRVCLLSTVTAQRGPAPAPSPVSARSPVPAPSLSKAIPAGIAAVQASFPLPLYLASTQADNPAIEWNNAIQWVVGNSSASYVAQRLFAFTHLAMWQALRANSASDSPADENAVAAFAAVLTLKDLMPQYFERYNLLFDQQTQNVSAANLTAAERIASPIVVSLLSSRLNDGFQLPPPESPTEGPAGVFLDLGSSGPPTQQWALTKPLLLPENLTSVDFVADCPPPPEVPSSAYSIEYTSVNLYGAEDSDVRSIDQTDTAYFWDVAAEGTSGIVGQWNRLCLDTIPSNLPLSSTAELLAKFNVGLFDTQVAVFRLKYEFPFWRPVTAIRNGDPSHDPQPDWTPLLSTPNTPSYPSTSSAFAGLVEVLLNKVYGRDAVTFTVSTENKGPSGTILPNRIYQSFTQVGTEVSQSRYFGGAEFPQDSIQGRYIGGEVASYVWDNFERLDVS